MESNTAYEEWDYLKTSLETIHGESKYVFYYLNRLNGASISIQANLLRDSNIYLSNEGTRLDNMRTIYNKLENDIDIVCSNYLKALKQLHDNDMNELESLSNSNIRYETVRDDESYLTHEEERLNAKRDAYSIFSFSLNNIINEYRANMMKIEKDNEESYTYLRDSVEHINQEVMMKNKTMNQGEIIPTSKEPNFIYNDGVISQYLSVDLVNKYPGSYLYKEYKSDRRTSSGDVYIDCDSTNEELIIRYMNNDQSINKEIVNMNYNDRSKLIDRLSFFELPVKQTLTSILEFNRESRMIEAWSNRRLITINGKNIPNLCEEIRRSGKLDEFYNDQILKNIHYNDSTRSFTADVQLSLKSFTIIEDYFKNNRQWNNRLLIVKGLKYTDIINEMKQFGIELNNNERKTLKEAWMDVRHIFINNQYYKSIDDAIRSSDQFIAIYTNYINTEHSFQNSYLYVNLDLKFTEILNDYLTNNRQWNMNLLVMSRLDYNVIYNEMVLNGIPVDNTDIKKLEKAWMNMRHIFVNNQHYKSIDDYLHSSDHFTSLYMSNMGTEQYISMEAPDKSGVSDHLFVTISLGYADVITKYIENGMKMNPQLLNGKISGRQFLSETKILGITLKQEDHIEVQKHFLKSIFMNLSNIIANHEYDEYLQNWLGNQKKWKLIYRASEHGYTSESFHQYCDDKGPTLIVIRSSNGCIFGGYTTESWRVTNLNVRKYEVKIDNDAFLFTLKNEHGVVPTRYNVHIKYGGISCSSSKGPIFCDLDGHMDIFIPNNCYKENICTVHSDGMEGYECDPTYRKSLFVNTAEPDVKNPFTIDEYEVFCHEEDSSQIII